MVYRSIFIADYRYSVKIYDEKTPHNAGFNYNGSYVFLYTESGFTTDFTDSVVKDFVLWDVSEAHQSGFSLPA